MDKRYVELSDWSAGLEVGIVSIDAQHRQLFELAASFAGDGDQIRVMKTLAMLSDYIKTHLREEEEMMAACGFPGLEAHRRLHAEFRVMLYGLLENAKTLSLDAIADEVRYLINGWFFRHIMVADQEYVPYVRAAETRQDSDTRPTAPTDPWGMDEV